jgi:hypothetical protein
VEVSSGITQLSYSRFLCGNWSSKFGANHRSLTTELLHIIISEIRKSSSNQKDEQKVNQ